MKELMSNHSIAGGHDGVDETVKGNSGTGCSFLILSHQI